MGKHVVLAIASSAQEALLHAALESHNIGVATVPPAAHLETEIVRALHAGGHPTLVVVDLAVLAQLGTSVGSFCAWKASRCAAARLFFSCCTLYRVMPWEQGWARRHGALGLVCGGSALYWRDTVVPAVSPLLGALDAELDQGKLERAMASLPHAHRDGGLAGKMCAAAMNPGGIGMPARALFERLRGAGGPQVKDRPYHLHRYSECFVGSEAVDWMTRETGAERAQAVRAGQALLDAGYLYHVAREQPFLDGFYFYRFATDSSRLANIDLNDLLMRFRAHGGVAIRDRMFHAIRFPACFVGAEAVAWLTRECGLTHNEAMTLGQRLIDLFVFHHVVDEHPFKDGDFYYRFYEDEHYGS